MLMRFGMGIRLSNEEQRIIEPIVKPCYAALGLANDYFSFDIEWQEFQSESDKTAMTNAVWLFMQWDGLDIQQAKRRVREVTNRYEKEYKQRVAEFVAGEGKDNIKLQSYLKAEGHQIPGNVAWSLRCPRYHPELCTEAARALRKGNTAMTSEGNTHKSHTSAESRSRSHSDSDLSDASPTFWSGSARSSVSSSSSLTEKHDRIEQDTLGDEVGKYCCFD